MENDWEAARRYLSQITVISHPNNEPVTIEGEPEGIRCIGVGTDAAAFQFENAPEYAFKMYAEDKVFKIEVEKQIYNSIGSSPFFATCITSSDRYLVLSYEKGMTLFDCLLQGIHIPEQVVKDVEDARVYVRKKGLNPRDIHLKNILLQNGRAKILDVSEYNQPGNDSRWEHLKKAYENYYHLIDGKAIPFWLVETVRKWYNHRLKSFSSYEEFMKTIVKFNMLKR